MKLTNLAPIFFNTLVKSRTIFIALAIGCAFLLIPGCEDKAPEPEPDTEKEPEVPVPPTTTPIVAVVLAKDSVRQLTMTGSIAYDGGEAITERGFCFTEGPHPDIVTGTKVVAPLTGAYTAKYSNLDLGKTYYVRGYAINKKGIGYGPAISFATVIREHDMSLDRIINITKNSATCVVLMRDNGAAPVLERGICWSQDPMPTKEYNNVSYGPGVSNFSFAFINLESGKSYYARAYMTTAQKTTYSYSIKFTTL